MGSVFKHTGDGVCAAFASPRAAVDAAIEAQQALELPVRMGIATGEAELRGSDYFGAVLNRAARVMAAGHGGQILLDGVTAGLLRGVDLLDLGSRRLRDIAQPVQVFQVRAAGLRTEFPPLSPSIRQQGTCASRPPASSDVSRTRGYAAAARKAHQVVTLTGAGGVGKTRLALEAAAELAEDFPRWGLGYRIGQRHRPSGGTRCVRRRSRDHPAAWARVWPTVWPPRWKAGSDCSCLTTSGANPKVVQRMLGHASAAMTLDVYADLFESDLDDVAVNVSRMCPRWASSP